MKKEILAFAERVESEIPLDPFFDGMRDDIKNKNIDVSFGRKYAKLIIRDRDGGGGSVWGFVDMENGDLLMAAGWKKPAKHARGNIADAAYGANYRWTGPNYL